MVSFYYLQYTKLVCLVHQIIHSDSIKVTNKMCSFINRMALLLVG